MYRQNFFAIFDQVTESLRERSGTDTVNILEL